MTSVREDLMEALRLYEEEEKKRMWDTSLKIRTTDKL
jgi:hypothetical protein